MNNTYKTSTTTKLTLIGSATILVALVLTSQPSQADENQQSSQRRGPPPEAFTACEGKNSGEAAKFQNASEPAEEVEGLKDLLDALTRGSKQVLERIDQYNDRRYR